MYNDGLVQRTTIHVKAGDEGLSAKHEIKLKRFAGGHMKSSGMF